MAAFCPGARYNLVMEGFVHDAVLDMHMARNELMSALADVGPDDWGRHVPYGSRTLHDLLALAAGADHAWALAAQGLLRGDGGVASPLSLAEADAARERRMKRGRSRKPAELLEEMERRRKLLLGLYDLLEPRHLALALKSFGDEHNSARERIWLGYLDRQHAADVRRALRLTWQPQRLKFLLQLQPAVDALAPDPTLYVIYNVDPVNWELPSPVPDWTYRQLLMHIATGDWVLQTHLRHLIEHNAVAAWPDVTAGNAERLAERRHSPDRTLTEEFISMRHETFVLLSQLKPKHLDIKIEMRWLPPPTTHTVLEYLLWFEQHERAHDEQLRAGMRWVRAYGGH
jgi:hypothetical protein